MSEIFVSYDLPFKNDEIGLSVKGRNGTYFALYIADPQNFNIYYYRDDGVHEWTYKNRFGVPVQEIEERADHVLIRLQGGPDVIAELDLSERSVHRYK